NDQALGGVLDIVERFKRHTAGERRVADDGQNLFIGARMIAARRHAERRGKGGTRVTRAETIVRTLFTQREAHGAARLANLGKLLAASGEKLVDINLMADVPNETILGRAEDAVHGDAQLDHAEVRAQVAARLAQHADQFLADLLPERRELLIRQKLHVR